ncbi:MAG TPA: hypothetical protein VLQ91_02765 [Draconibacterium sp.]|nr:hypothetical protein [Draconibacterium sp.]
MKTSKLTKLAWVFFALAVTSTTLYAQGWRNANRIGNSCNNYCLTQISGFTDEQKIKIDGLNETHQAKMAELRTQRQSTTDAIEKSEIRTSMLKTVKVHRDEVKSLLTAEQQKEYDLLQARGNYGNGRGNGNFQGRGQGRCQQFAGTQCCVARGYRGGGGQGYGRGNRQNQGCFRN